MDNTVKQRLISFIRYKELSNQRFEKMVGLANGYVNNIRKSITNEKLQKIALIFPDLNKGWLLTGEGKMLKESVYDYDEEGDKAQFVSESDSIQYNSSKKENGLPLIPVDAMAGALSGEGFSFLEYECEKYIVPIFKGAEFLIRVQGDSMTPLYNAGDLVACQRVPLGDIWFQWGKVYVIDTRQGVLVKRINCSKKKGCISLHSENSKYDPFDIPTSEINGVAIVRGLIRVE